MKSFFVALALVALALSSCDSGRLPGFVHDYGTGEADQHGHNLHGEGTPHPGAATPTPAR